MSDDCPYFYPPGVKCPGCGQVKQPMVDPLKRTVGGPQAPCLSGQPDWMCDRCDCWKSARAYCS